MPAPTAMPRASVPATVKVDRFMSKPPSRYVAFQWRFRRFAVSFTARDDTWPMPMPTSSRPLPGLPACAPPHASFHVRTVLNEARTSSVKIFGCSHAAKWQPLGVRP